MMGAGRNRRYPRGLQCTGPRRCVAANGSLSPAQATCMWLEEVLVPRYPRAQSAGSCGPPAEERIFLSRCAGFFVPANISSGRDSPPSAAVINAFRRRHRGDKRVLIEGRVQVRWQAKLRHLLLEPTRLRKPKIDGSKRLAVKAPSLKPLAEVGILHSTPHRAISHAARMDHTHATVSAKSRQRALPPQEAPIEANSLAAFLA